MGCCTAVGRATGEPGTTKDPQDESIYTNSEINSLVDAEVARKLSEMNLEEWQLSIDKNIQEQITLYSEIEKNTKELVYEIVSDIAEGPQGVPGPQGPEGPQGRPGFNGSDGTIEDASIDDLDDGYVIWDLESELSSLQSDLSDLEDLVEGIADTVENLEEDMYGYGVIADLEYYLSNLGDDLETVYDAYNKHVSRFGGGNHHSH